MAMRRTKRVSARRQSRVVGASLAHPRRRFPSLLCEGGEEARVSVFGEDESKMACKVAHEDEACLFR